MVGEQTGILQGGEVAAQACVDAVGTLIEVAGAGLAAEAVAAAAEVDVGVARECNSCFSLTVTDCSKWLTSFLTRSGEHMHAYSTGSSMHVAPCGL